jgi:integrase
MPQHLDVLRAHQAAQRASMITRLKRQRVPNVDAALGESLGWVFPARHPGKFMHNTAPRKALHLALKKAKLSLDFTIHGFRHTFNDLVRKLADGIVVRAMTGPQLGGDDRALRQGRDREKCEVVEKLLRLVQGGD